MNPEQRKRTFDAVDQSYRELQPFRDLNMALVEEYAGNGFTGAGQIPGRRREIVVNLLNQTVQAYMMALASNRPQVLITTELSNLLPFAKHYEVGLNRLLDEIGIKHTIRRWVLDAFLCIGIVKVHMGGSAFVQLEQDLWADPGKPFASNVSLDNWVHDMTATKWSEIQFAGDVYRIPWEDLQDPIVYNQDVAKDIKPSSKTETDSSRLENIARGALTDRGECYPMVDLIDLWLPRDGVIETYPCDFKNGSLKPHGEPVAVMEWTGPEFGNYKLLRFGEVPENIMPSSPASQLVTLAKHINNVYRKQVKSARDFKQVTTYGPGAEKDARSLKTAGHQDLVCVQDPKEIGTIITGGVSPELAQFQLGMMNDYNMAAGNVVAMLGLGAQAETVGQERLIHSAISGMTSYMANQVTEAVTSLVRDLGHLMWNDQFNVITAQMPLDGLPGYSTDASWRPGDREGSFNDYDFDIDVYSMSYKSPSDRANAIIQLLTQVYAPLSQLIMMQGGVINFQALTEILADLYDEPRLKQVVQFISAMPEMGDMVSGGKPSSTSREYVRKSVSAGGSAQGQNVSQQQAWASMAGRQGAQAGTQMAG